MKAVKCREEVEVVDPVADPEVVLVEVSVAVQVLVAVHVQEDQEACHHLDLQHLLVAIQTTMMTMMKQILTLQKRVK